VRLGTKLALYLSFIIILVLSKYGYLDILSRRDVLVRNRSKMAYFSSKGDLKKGRILEEG